MHPTPHNWREARRLQAWHLKQQDWSQRQMAEALVVSDGAVRQGMARARSRVAAIIRLAFGVTYQPRPVGRILDAPRWSPQNPARRARQRNEAAIAQWRDETWPAIKTAHRSSSKRFSP
jgi:Winged helix-turn helix